MHKRNTFEEHPPHPGTMSSEKHASALDTTASEAGETYAAVHLCILHDMTLSAPSLRRETR